jgi:hypothetical protein
MQVGPTRQGRKSHDVWVQKKAETIVWVMERWILDICSPVAVVEAGDP